MRRPVFWFLWPEATPGPLDGEATTTRWLRVCGRGPWRWAFLIACSALVVTGVSAAAASTLARPSIVTAMLTVLVAVPSVALLARAWVAGTYVNDHGLKVSAVLTTTVIPWSSVTAITERRGSRLLGTPARGGGTQVVITWTDGACATHVETNSPDLWLRPQAFAAARDRIATWYAETR